LARDVSLERVGGAGLDEVPLAVRALGDLLGRRWRAVPVGAVGIAGLAAGCFGIGLGRAFAERGGLTLAGANGLIQLPGQFGDLGCAFGNLFGEFPTA
jgi:hypothetical protein